MADAGTRLPEKDDKTSDAVPRKDRVDGNPAPPRAGRVGVMGARAERPSDKKPKTTGEPPPSRGAKSPSATGDEQELPQPARDSTT